MKFQDQLRAIISQQEATPYKIAKDAGIHKSSMSRFMTGGSLTLSNIDRLQEVLGLEVKATKQVHPAHRGRPVK